MAVMYYRTKDGLADYGFSMEQQPNGSWRPYIVSQPSYRGRDESAHITHRLTNDADGRRYVCWTTELRTIEDAKKVAETWADNTQRYIRFGERFG